MNQEQHNELARVLLKHSEAGGEEIVRRDDFLIDEAKHEGSPLHSCFTWRDDAAAHLYRRQQAARLLSKFKVQRVDPVIRENFLQMENIEVTPVDMGVGMMRSMDGGMELVESPEQLLAQFVGDRACSTNLPALIKRYKPALEESGLDSVVKDLRLIEGKVRRYLAARTNGEAA